MRVFARIAAVLPRRVAVSLSLLTLAGAASCLDLNPTTTACSVTIAPTNITLSVNQSATVVGTAFDCSKNTIPASKKTILFASSNPAAATITPTGTVIAIAIGTTQISATADGQSATATVTVGPEVPTSVTINPPTLTLRRTNTRQLAAVARNASQAVIPGATFRWSSSNTAIASVDASGNVVALTAGQVSVTADVNNVFGTSLVTVTEIPIGTCALVPTTYKVTTGQSVQPALTLRDTASGVLTNLGRPIAWISDNENVATVSSSGLITTRKAGSAKISASSVEYPSVTCATAVTVVDPRIVQVVVTPRTGSLRLGIPRGLGVTLLDSVNNAIPSGRVVTWSTNTPTVAQVSQAGIVTGIALGTARLIATSEGVADTVSFPVTAIPVGSISVTPVQATVLEGQTVQITATVLDSAGTTVTDRPIEWLTSDPTKATVSSTGRVTAISAGAVSIGATTEGRLAQSTVIIQQIPADTIVVTTSTISMKTGVANQTAFAYIVRDAQGNQLRNRTVSIANTAPGVLNATQQTTADQVQLLGLVPGSATLTMQVLNSNGRAEGKPTIVTVTVTAPTAAPIRSSP
jgi:uncharacterized protein YjdB